MLSTFYNCLLVTESWSGLIQIPPPPTPKIKFLQPCEEEFLSLTDLVVEGCFIQGFSVSC